MAEIPTVIQNLLGNYITEFSQNCCETKIDAHHHLFDFLKQKFLAAWKYFHSQEKESEDCVHLLQSPVVRTCLRDLLLANTVNFYRKVFILIDEENSPALVRIIINKRWRYEQIVGKDARPIEVIHDFYADMTAREKWSIFKGYTRLSSWLPIYLHAFLRDALNQGMRDLDNDVTPFCNKEEVNSRDRRMVSFGEGQEIEHESDPQKEWILNTIRNIVQQVFSQLSPKQLQFLCLLRANSCKGTTQKELAQVLGIADYKLTRMKAGLHKQFYDLLENEVQKRFPTMKNHSLRSLMTLDDLLGMLEKEAENTIAPDDARNSSHETQPPHFHDSRGTAHLVRTEYSD